MVKWNKDAFVVASKKECEPRISNIIIDLVNFAESEADIISWGRGKGYGTMTYKCKSVESFNLAQVNATQTHDILTLSLYAIKVRPQIVISFTGWNELVTNKGYKKEILQNYGIFYIEELEGWESDDLTGNKKKFLKKYFIFLSCNDDFIYFTHCFYFLLNSERTGNYCKR